MKRAHAALPVHPSLLIPHTFLIRLKFKTYTQRICNQNSAMSKSNEKQMLRSQHHPSFLSPHSYFNSMLHRLQHFLRQAMPALVIWFLTALPLFSQQPQNFNFNYPGPFNLVLSSACKTALFGKLGTPVVSSAIGSTITASFFDSTASGFSILLEHSGVQTKTVIWRVEDAAGNWANFSFNINLQDNQPPVIAAPANITVLSAQQVPPPADVTATDNCTASNNINIELIQNPTPPPCSTLTFLRVWMATDDAGNTSVASQQITISQEINPPLIDAFPQNGSGTCTNFATSYPAWLAAQTAIFHATDPSGIQSYQIFEHPAPPPGCTRQFKVTFTAVDSCGAGSETDAIFTLEDDTPPVFSTAPRDSIVSCQPTGGAQLVALGNFIKTRGWSTANDGCTPQNQLQFSMKINGNVVDSAQVVAAFLASFSNACSEQIIGGNTIQKVRGIVPVDFEAKDLCGKTTVEQAIFAAMDTIAPILTAAQDTTFENCGNADDQPKLVQWIENHGNLTATDECSTTFWKDFDWKTSTGQTGIGQYGQSATFPQIAANDCFWSVEVNFKIEDECQNFSQKKTHFALRDNEPPTFAALPAADTIFCPEPLPQNLPAAVSDNCDASPSVNFNLTFEKNLCAGSREFLATWTATDDCGNVATTTQKLILLDTVAPVFQKIPADTVVACDKIPALPQIGSDIIAADVCGSLDKILFEETNQQNPNPSLCSHYNYLIFRKFTAIDSCGNARIRIQKIEVRDTTPPIFAGFLDTLQTCENLFSLPDPTATGDCGQPVSTPFLKTQTIAAGICPDDYVLTLTWESTDVCGNLGTFEQTVEVRDTTFPVLEGVPDDVQVGCQNIPAEPQIGSQIIGADNCDEDVFVEFLPAEIRNPDPADCDHWANYFIVRKWRAMDNCYHEVLDSQTIWVQDDTPPAIACPTAVAFPNTLDACTADIGLPLPISIFDECTALKINALTADSTLIKNTSGLDPNDSPVDTLLLTLAAPNSLPASPAVGTANLTIVMEKADAEAATEFFEIFDEKNELVGTTPATSSQCGSGSATISVPAARVNAWFSDGGETFKIVPVGTGSAAVNAICAGGQVKFSLGFEYLQPQIPVGIEFSLDGAARADFPAASNFSLGVGSHSLVFFATDCAGNESSCSTTISVSDIQIPSVSVSTNQILAFSKTDDCDGTVILPLPTVAENCGLSENFSKKTATLPLVFEQDGNAGLVPTDIWLEFPAAVPNAMTGGKLTIRHRGDNAQAGEFFRIFDENGQPIDKTSTGAAGGECQNFHESNFNLTALKINELAADGIVKIRLSANRDAANFSDFISPCGTLNGQNQDGISAVEGWLEYDFAKVIFEIKNSAGVVVSSGQVVGTATEIEVPAGDFSINYKVADAAGNFGNADLNLQVRDTVPPAAKCQPTTIFTNPSGAEAYSLTAMQVNAGSLDNCTAAADLVFSLSKTSFTCSDAGSLVPISMQVRDASGNVSTCQTQVKIETEIFQPTFQTGVCEGGAVQLFANPPIPAGQGGTLFTFDWSGVGGFVSKLENPTVPAVFSDGNFVVTVTGLTGCTASATASVKIQTLPTQPVLTATKIDLCDGEDLQLHTPVFNGNGVEYQWFAGAPATAVLLGTTIVPDFLVPKPSIGNYQFFVKIKGDGCTSVPSDLLDVRVFGKPTATVQQTLISLCEGEALVLGAVEQGLGITYQWTGANGFSSSQQFPTVISSVSMIDSGFYSLTVFQNGCPSPVAKTHVAVRQKPAQPSLQTDAPACVGETVTMVCNALSASQYVWVSPFFEQDTTSINSLILNNVALADSGKWQVFVLQSGCRSDASAPVSVAVQAFPQVTASANSPLCLGDTLFLKATADQSSLTYHWTGPANFSIFQQNPTWSSISGSYKVVATTSFGCADTAFVNVEVAPVPQISQLKFSAPWVSNIQGCVSGTDSLVLEANISPVGVYTYSWTGPGGFASAAAKPVLPNANASMSGTYTLHVESQYGCAAADKSIAVTLRDRPVVPILETAAPVCEGQNLEILVKNASDYNGSNLQFFWKTPTATPTTAVGKLVLANATPANHSGNYSVQVSIANCPSLESAPLAAVVHPTPLAPSISGTTPLCAGDTLQLSVPMVPGMTYLWSGPAGFTASVSNPVLTNISANQAGQYFVLVSQNGCLSPFSEAFELAVKPSPATPVAQNDGSVCLDFSGEKLNLSVVPNPQNQGALFQWFNGSTGLPLGSPTAGQTFQVSDFQNFTAGQQPFFVVANLNGCRSAASAPTLVQFDKVPQQTAFAGADFKACAGSIFNLNAEKPAIGTGAWVQISGSPLSVLNPSDAASGVTGGLGGETYFLTWNLSNGACKNYDLDSVAVAVSDFVPADGGFWVDTCFADLVEISAAASQAGIGSWSQPQDQAVFLGIQIANPSSGTTQVSGFQGTNKYFFVWTMPDAGCGVSRDTVVVRTIGTVAFAGKDERICNPQAQTQILGNQLKDFETGIWTSPADATLEIANPTDAQTTVKNLKPGKNLLVWTTNEAQCGDRSRDSLVLTYEIQPVAALDSLVVPFGHKISFDVLKNDVLPSPFELSLKTSPQFGTLTDLEIGKFSYLPELNFSGEDGFLYEVCNPNCPLNDCGIGTVKLVVGEPIGCDVPTIVTPNEDGVNDAWAVPCLGSDAFPDNEIWIFNEWGDEVFHQQPYRSAWDGRRDGVELPAGVYFFVVRFNGSQGVSSGFIQLQR